MHRPGVAVALAVVLITSLLAGSLAAGHAPSAGAHPSAHPSALPFRTGLAVHSEPAHFTAMVHPALAPGVTEIEPNGTVNNVSAPIHVSGNIYTLTANFSGALLDERNGSTLDGAGFQIVASGVASWVVAVLQATGVTIENLLVRNASTGIYAAGVSGLDLLRDNVSASGFAFEVEESSAILAQNDWSNGSRGSYWYDDSDLTIANNVFTHSTDAGADVEDSTNVAVRDNQANGSFYGVYGYAVDGLLIWGNNLSSAREGAYVDASRNIVVTWNNASFDRETIYIEYSVNLTGTHDAGEGGQYGLDIEEDVAATFSWLTLPQMSSTAIYLYGDQGARVDHTIGTSSSEALYVEYSTGFEASEDNLSGAGSEGAYIEYSVAGFLGNDTASTPVADGEGFYSEYDTSMTFENDTAVGTAFPLYDYYTSGYIVLGGDYAHETLHGYAVYLEGETNALLSHVDLYNASGYGLEAYYVNGLDLLDDNLTWAGYDGVYIDESSNVTLQGCSADHAQNDVGIDLEDDAGVAVIDSSARDVAGTNGEGFSGDGLVGGIVEGSAFDGTYLSIVADSSTSLAVVGNNGSSSAYGLWENGDVNTSFIGNTFWADAHSFYVEGGEGIWIYHNNFIGEHNWSVDTATVSSSFHWDGGYPVGGNFWSNHTAPDNKSGANQSASGGDGIVDTPLAINATNVDHYPLAAAWAVHTVTLTETGLASGSRWTANFAGTSLSSTGSTIVWPEPNAANSPFSFSVGRVNGYNAPSPGAGVGTMSRSNLAFNVVFTPFTFTVDFAATGLASGTSWSIDLGGQTLSSTTGSIAFTVANGTYNYSAGAVTGYVASNTAGTLTVAGHGATIALAYTAIHPAGGSSSGSSSGQYSSTVVYALIGLVILFGLLAALGFARRRRQNPPPASPWMSSPPPPGSPPPAGGTPPPGATGGSPPPGAT